MWLTADFFNESDFLVQLCVYLHAANSKRKFRLFFGLYPKVRARLRLPSDALKLNAWALKREGALLKPKCGGDTILPEEVEFLAMEMAAKPDGPVAIRQTPWQFVETPPPMLEKAESSYPALLDSLGQADFREWPGKTKSVGAMTDSLQKQAAAGPQSFPKEWSKWGGWKEKTFEASGFFRTEHDGSRWWLVDPSGCAFWSAGLNCVRPQVESWLPGLEHLVPKGLKTGTAPQVDFLGKNFERTFGPDWQDEWRTITLNFLRGVRVNTFGNWSDWSVAAAAQFPYTRPLAKFDLSKVPGIFRDFPDIFDPAFGDECARWAAQLEETADDPALIGYFLTNEPTWCFAKQTPASGMLTNTHDCWTRRDLANWLRSRYDSESALGRAWERETSFAEVETGRWTLVPESNGFVRDMEEYSGLMAAKLFGTMAGACRRSAPNQLNLGARFAFLPHDWMMDAMGFADVFSFNSYSKTPREHGGIISQRLNRPVLIGEWHFGALDVGQPSGAVETVRGQRDRAGAYRNFVESHAALPWAVGTHWFTLYDQSAVGRSDGECYNIGLLDVCNQPYPEFCAAATRTHERIYDLATGRMKPHWEDVEYLPRLSL